MENTHIGPENSERIEYDGGGSVQKNLVSKGFFGSKYTFTVTDKNNHTNTINPPLFTEFIGQKKSARVADIIFKNINKIFEQGNFDWDQFNIPADEIASVTNKEVSGIAPDKAKAGFIGKLLTKKINQCIKKQIIPNDNKTTPMASEGAGPATEGKEPVMPIEEQEAYKPSEGNFEPPQVHQLQLREDHSAQAIIRMAPPVFEHITPTEINTTGSTVPRLEKPYMPSGGPKRPHLSEEEEEALEAKERERKKQEEEEIFQQKEKELNTLFINTSEQLEAEMRKDGISPTSSLNTQKRTLESPIDMQNPIKDDATTPSEQTPSLLDQLNQLGASLPKKTRLSKQAEAALEAQKKAKEREQRKQAEEDRFQEKAKEFDNLMVHTLMKLNDAMKEDDTSSTSPLSTRKPMAENPIEMQNPIKDDTTTPSEKTPSLLDQLNQLGASLPKKPQLSEQEEAALEAKKREQRKQAGEDRFQKNLGELNSLFEQSLEKLDKQDKE